MSFDPDKKILNSFFIKLDPRLDNLTSKEKVKLIDSIGVSNGSKGIVVDFPFSHSGRLINRRIYSKKGQAKVAKDIYAPYPKPITLDHEDKVNNIIGRIVHGTYVDTIDEARLFFRKRRWSEKALDQLNESLVDLDFEKMADALHKTKVLLHKDWKGLGRVEAKARISDPEAIIKFLDQRYLNFSAEQTTDSYVCSICLSDWKKDGLCEHMPGTFYDSKLAFSMCGNMDGWGSSVVVTPADEDSVVTNIDLSDTSESPLEILSKLLDNLVVDSSIFIEEEKMNLFERYLKDESLTEDELYELYSEILGDKKLDKVEFSKLPDNVKVKGLPLIDEETANLVKDFLSNYLKSLTAELSAELVENKDSNVAFNLLSQKLAFLTEEIEVTDSQAQIGAVVSLLQSNELPNTEEIVTAIKKAVSTLNIEIDSDSKNEIITLKTTIDELNAKLSDKDNLEALREKEKNRLLTIEYRNLIKDHIAIVNKYDTLLEDNSSLLDKVVPLINIIEPATDISDKNLEKIFNLLDSLDKKSLESKLNDGTSVSQLQEIENFTNTVQLSDFDKKTLDNYNRLLETEGKKVAEAYFRKNKPYCSKDFDPKSLGSK